MTVNLDVRDRTWITHTEGFLAILRQQSPSTHASFASLACALSIVNERDEDGHRNVPSIEVQKNIAILRLRSLASRAPLLLSPAAMKPRQLEVLKLRRDVKKIHVDVCLMQPDLVVHTLAILTASLLIDIDMYLKSTFDTTNQYGKLSKFIRNAVEEIQAEAVVLLDRASLSTIDAIRLSGPLYAAMTATPDRKSSFRAILWRIGEVGKVPSAFRLVSIYRYMALKRTNETKAEDNGENVKYEDVLAGLIITSQLNG